MSSRFALSVHRPAGRKLSHRACFGRFCPLRPPRGAGASFAACSRRPEVSGGGENGPEARERANKWSASASQSSDLGDDRCHRRWSLRQIGILRSRVDWPDEVGGTTFGSVALMSGGDSHCRLWVRMPGGGGGEAVDARQNKVTPKLPNKCSPIIPGMIFPAILASSEVAKQMSQSCTAVSQRRAQMRPAVNPGFGPCRGRALATM